MNWDFNRVDPDVFLKDPKIQRNYQIVKAFSEGKGIEWISCEFNISERQAWRIKEKYESLTKYGITKI